MEEDGDGSEMSSRTAATEAAAASLYDIQSTAAATSRSYERIQVDLGSGFAPAILLGKRDTGVLSLRKPLGKTLARSRNVHICQRVIPNYVYCLQG